MNRSTRRSGRRSNDSIWGWLLGRSYTRAVEGTFAADPALQARRHNALIDARVNRDAYFADKQVLAFELAELQELRHLDPELDQTLNDIFDTESKAASWWTTPLRMLKGKKPSEAFAAGNRTEVVRELYAIKYGIPP